LALQLGIWDVETWLDVMSYEQFRLWQKYHEIEPSGPYRDDLRAGVIASTIVNVNKKKSARPCQPGDFIYDFPKAYEKRLTRKPLTSVDQWRKFKESLTEEFS
jgi:hypothetical protein